MINGGSFIKKLILGFAVAVAFAFVPHASAQNQELQRWEQQAREVSIIRDDWGIANISGKTDADAVFGMIYAQAEDDFNRVETNYLNAMGRLAEAEGESAVWRDLRMKIFISPEAMKTQYETCPAWLKALMNSWAGGLNFYLAKHPEVKPRVIRRFEPWMALSFTEGSIGGDIETINLNQLQAFYGNASAAVGRNDSGTGVSPVDHAQDARATDSGTGVSPVDHAQDARATDESELETEPAGSNGVAISPSNTIARHALLLLNPHTSFFFRSELQMTSDDGLNAYGAVTWGQFFIYQGFNERCGWMHTTSAVDAIDEYLETVVKKGDQFYYKYGNEERPVMTSVIKVPYKTDTGMAGKTFTVYRTKHGPVVRLLNDKWVSIILMQEPVKALTQSYTPTKAKDYKALPQTR